MATAPDIKNAYALIIGISEYKDPDIPGLKFTHADAEGVFRLLTDPKKLGIPKDNVRMLLDRDATAFGIKNSISKWLFRNAGEDSVVFIFFAGHGGVEEDRLGLEKDNLAKYLLPYDAVFEDFFSSAISNRDFNDLLLTIKSKKLVIFMDSCYSGGVSERKARDVKISDDPYQKLAEGEGRLVIAASQPDQRSFEDARIGHGVFTYNLLEALSGKADGDSDGCVTALDAYKYLQDAVPRDAMRLAGGKQEPVLRGDITKDFVISIDRERFEKIGKEGVIQRKISRLLELRHQDKLSGKQYARLREIVKTDIEKLSDRDKKIAKLFDDLLTEDISITAFIEDLGVVEPELSPEKKRQERERIKREEEERIKREKEKALKQEEERRRIESSKKGKKAREESAHVKLDEMEYEDMKHQNLERLGEWYYNDELSPEDYEIACRVIESSSDALDTNDRKVLKLVNDLLADRITISRFTKGVRQFKRIRKHSATAKPEIVKKEMKKEKEIESQIENSIGMEFVLIPAGEFDMGSPANEAGRYGDEGPMHHVTIPDGFYLGKYEVTQKQWRDVMGTSPSYFTGDDLPVEQVSWDDVQQFIQKLNEKESTDSYRLPSEAEWEYAARAGTATRYSFGDDESKLGEYAWYDANSGSKTHTIGQKNPNPWGLYDMHGNVWEWVQDVWHSDYNGAPADGSAWEGDGSLRVVRGGSWRSSAGDCRSANRNYNAPGNRRNNLGFRLLRDM